MKNLLVKIASIATELDYAGLTKEAKQMHSVFIKIAKYAQSPLRVHAFKAELAEAQKEFLKAENAYFREMEKMENQEYFDRFLFSDKRFEIAPNRVMAGTLLAKKNRAERRLNYVLERLKNEGLEQIFEPIHAEQPKVSLEKAEIFEYLARNFLEEEERLNDNNSQTEMEKYQKIENANLISRKQQEEEQRENQRKIDEKLKITQEQRDAQEKYYANIDPDELERMNEESRKYFKAQEAAEKAEKERQEYLERERNRPYEPVR